MTGGFDDDRVRGFPAFGAVTGRGAHAPGRSWWSRAWVAAMEDTSLDPAALRRGRRFARAGTVGSITVSPGRIAAPVYADRPVPYRTVVHVERLTDAAWDRLLGEVAAKAGHIAALLDAEVPADLVADADSAGVRLLPGLGDLEPGCDCHDWGHPCEHAAALSYQASWLLDADPFVLLLMRGRGRAELLAELARRNAAGTARPPGAAVPELGPAPAPAGTPAAEAYASVPPPLPEPPAVPDRAGAPPGVPAAPGVDPAALALLARDAAARARDLLAGGPPAPADRYADAARLAAALLHGGPAGGPAADPAVRAALGRLRAALPAGEPADALERAAAAWRHGGAAGLDVLRCAWRPPAVEMARARAAVTADGGTAEVTGHRCTDGGRQLRLGRDGRWYPYRRRAGAWWPAGPPHRDPGAALAELLPD